MKDISIKGFNNRILNDEYRLSINQYWKKHMKTLIENYILENNLSKSEKLINDKGIPHNEVNKMELNLEPKQKSDLNKEELELLRKIVEDKYSVGAFSGMLFNAYIDEYKKQNPDKKICPVTFVEIAVRMRKLLHDMI